MLAVLAVPRFARKLRAVRFKIFFGAQAAELRASLDLVVQTSMQLRGSELLQKMMQVRGLTHGTTMSAGAYVVNVCDIPARLFRRGRNRTQSGCERTVPRLCIVACPSALVVSPQRSTVFWSGCVRAREDGDGSMD